MVPWKIGYSRYSRLMPDAKPPLPNSQMVHACVQLRTASTSSTIEGRRIAPVLMAVPRVLELFEADGERRCGGVDCWCCGEGRRPSEERRSGVKTGGMVVKD